MKNYVDLLVEASEKFNLMVTAQDKAKVGVQSGDFFKAIVDSGVLGVVGERPNEHFDNNSKAADVIFGLMDKFGYRGIVSISVKISPNGQVDLLVNSKNAKLSAAIKQHFLPGVTMVVNKVGVPGEELVLKNLVMAQNA